MTTLTPGPKLDAEVAKACGYSTVFAHGGECGRRTRGNKVTLFNPSEDLNKAFEAAEKVGLFRRYRIMRNDSEWIIYHEDNLRLIFRGETLALAICDAITALN